MGMGGGGWAVGEGDCEVGGDEGEGAAWVGKGWVVSSGRSGVVGRRGNVGVGAGVEGAGFAGMLEGWGGEGDVGVFFVGRAVLDRGGRALGFFLDC